MRLIDADELKKPVGSYNPVKWTSEYGYVISLVDVDHAPTIDTSKELICSVNVNMDTDEVMERLKERGWEPVKHGRWIFSQNHAEGICTRCNFKIYGRPYNNTYMIVPYNYCPNCGARMDEVVV